MLKISRREALQVMVRCHEGLCVETLVWVPGNIWMGRMGHYIIGMKGSIVGYGIIHLAYVQVLLCKMLSRRQVKLSKELVHNALLRCLVWLHGPRALA